MVMEEAGNFLEFITATLHSLSPVPYPEFHHIHRTYPGPARGLSADLERFREFLEELFRELLY